MVAVACGLVLLVSAYATYKNTRDLLVASAGQMINALQHNVTTHISPAENLVKSLVSQISTGDPGLVSNEQLVIAMRAAMAGVPQITGIALIRPGGGEIQVRRSTGRRFQTITSSHLGNAALLTFIIQSRTGKKPRWSEPLHENGQSFIAYSAPLFHKGRFLGILAAGLAISDLSGFVQRLAANSAYTGFILYGSDAVLAHKNLPGLSARNLSAAAPLHPVSKIGDPVLAAMASAPVIRVADAGGFELRQTRRHGTASIILSRPYKRFGTTTWTIGVHAPASAVNDQVRRMRKSFMAGGALLLAALAMGVVLARRIASPIKSISAAASHIGTLDLASIAPLARSRIDELDKQASAFNQMLDALRWFETYVPRTLVRRMMRDKSGDPGASREAELTVMFTDIIGFTAMSENLAPRQTAAMLNAHFELLNRCIEQTGGTLDKYIGDAVMAFWGAPETRHDHARRACDAALLMARAFEHDDSGLRIKIAIHTGPLIVGNIGARARMNYTIIGDTVNTASRIEKLAGDLDAGARAIILLSEQTASQVKGRFNLAPAGEFTVKGRKKPVTVYRLLDDA